MQNHTRGEDRQVPGDCAGSRVHMSSDCKRSEVDGEVEVRTGKRLADGEAEEEIAGRDLAFCDHVLSQSRDNYGAAAENNRPCE
jgi:hypothetical protein